MIQLASAFAIRCYPWMAHLFSVAKENGLTDDEIGTIEGIVMAVSAGSLKVQFNQVRQNLEQNLGYD